MNQSEIAALSRQGLRWLFAAEQDSNPVVRHLHYSYAAAYFDILAEAASPEELRQYGGIDIRAVQERTRSGQDLVQRQLAVIVNPRETFPGIRGPGVPELRSGRRAVGLFGLGLAIGIAGVLAMDRLGRSRLDRKTVS